jgi:hypothetical protein
MTKTLIDTTQRGLEARAKHRRGTGTGVGAVNPPIFSRTSWAVFWPQFKTVAVYNCWTHLEKSTYLITTLQGQATDMLHRVPKGVTYEETLETLEDRFRDQHLAAAYHSQLKRRTQGFRESLEEFVTVDEQLAHRTYLALPEDHIRREVGRKEITERGSQAGS